MALGTFVAGRYVGVLNGASLGIVEKGYTISFNYGKELIQDTDVYGAAVIDAVYRGIVNCYMQTTFLEWIAGTLIALTPWAAAPFPAAGAGYLGPGVIGVLDTSLAAILVMTATAGTAAASSPASLTANQVILAENFDVSMLFGPYHRKIPVRFRIYPFVAASVVKLFTVT